MAKEMTLELDQRGIKNILENYVKPVMEKILLTHIESDIYGAYSPKAYAWIGGTTYNRRESLLNKDDFVSEVDGNTIYLTSAASTMGLFSEGSWVGGPGAFLAMLENGYMGAWSRVTGMSLPRPALSNAQNEIDNSAAIHDAVLRGIEHYYKHN